MTKKKSAGSCPVCRGDGLTPMCPECCLGPREAADRGAAAAAAVGRQTSNGTDGVLGAQHLSPVAGSERVTPERIAEIRAALAGVESEPGGRSWVVSSAVPLAMTHDLLAALDAVTIERDESRAGRRRAAEWLMTALGAEGPEYVDSLAHRAHDTIARLTRERDEARAEAGLLRTEQLKDKAVVAMANADADADRMTIKRLTRERDEVADRLIEIVEAMSAREDEQWSCADAMGYDESAAHHKKRTLAIDEVAAALKKAHPSAAAKLDDSARKARKGGG